MATVTGPLHSLEARGQLAQTIIYQESMGRHVVKAYGKPNWDTHPPTEAQLEIQAETKLLMQHWPDIAPADQATWDALAIPAAISRVNAYLQENYRLFLAGRTRRDRWPLSTQVRIYSGGTATPDLSNWMPPYNHTNWLDLFAKEVWADVDDTGINTFTDYDLDGQFDLRGLPNLTTVHSDSTAITTAPIVTGCAKLVMYMVFGCPVTNLPNLAGMPDFNGLAMANTDVANFDQIFLDLAGTTVEEGDITIAGATNSRVTAASNAARAAIHAKGWSHTGWDETQL